MTLRLRVGVDGRKKWLVLLGLGAALTSMAGGQATHSPRATEDPRTPPGLREPTSGSPVEVSCDARTLAAELTALAAVGERVSGGRGGRSLAPAAGVVRAWQWNEGRGCPPLHPYFGGTGRWPGSAPDLQ